MGRIQEILMLVLIKLVALLRFPARKIIKDSGLFDSRYYLKAYPDIAAAQLDPFAHFIAYGAAEQRNPNPWFHSAWYTHHYPEVGFTGNPLLHYLLRGAKEGRDPSPWFSTTDYLLRHPGLLERKINPLVHYIASGNAKSPDELQSRLVLQNNAVRTVKSPELTDLVDFPPRQLGPVEKAYDPSSLDVHWVIPDFGIGGGGHQTIFRMVSLLEQFGHRCTVWITHPTANKSERSANEIAVRHYKTIKGAIRFMSSEFFDMPGDAVICTSWDTVTFGMHATGFKDRFYFVQDYEPAFYATGPHSLAAEWTYKNDIACICASPWLAEKIGTHYGRWTMAGWLAADLSIYHPAPDTRDPADLPRVAFYARRHTERRAVDLGLMALEVLAGKGVKFHVEFFGMKLNLGNLPYSFTDNGVLDEEGLAKLYHRSDVGVVFSSTNYSLVPQEMMASGLAVLELDGESTRRIYPQGVVALAGPHPLDIAEKLEALLEDRELRTGQAAAALNWVRQFSWEDFARVVERALLERLSAKGYTASIGISAPLVAGEKPKASVVIPTCNGGDLFSKVLSAIKAQQASWPFEIIVIDSGSTDGSAECAAESDEVIFHSIPRREFQHGRTRNLGIDMASGQYVLFVTQDALPFDKLWLNNMIAVMDKYPNAAGAFGRQIAYPDAWPFLKRDIANRFASFDANPLAVSKYTHFRNWSSGDVSWRQTLYFYSNKNSCVRRSVWNTIPFPNIEFGEDQAWAARIIDAGYEKLYVPSAAVYHSYNYVPSEMFEESQLQGHFFKKYFGYDCAPKKRQLGAAIAKMNAGDEQWASVNGIDSHWVSLQRQLNEAKIKGLWAGMMSASYVGYQKDPIADDAE